MYSAACLAALKISVTLGAGAAKDSVEDADLARLWPIAEERLFFAPSSAASSSVGSFALNY
jgi:hypothetical protein